MKNIFDRFNRSFFRFILKLRLDYLHKCRRDLIFLTQDNGEAQPHIDAAKDSLTIAIRKMEEMRENV